MNRQSDKIKQIAAQYYAQLLLEQPDSHATTLDLSSLIHDNGALRYNFQMIANERLEAIGGSSFGMPFGNTARIIVQWIKYWDELRIRRYIIARASRRTALYERIPPVDELIEAMDAGTSRGSDYIRGVR